MSKMGRYVFELQEENQQYDYPDREGCTDAESHPLARVTIHGDGDRGLVRRPVPSSDSRLIQALRQRVTRFQNKTRHKNSASCKTANR